MKSLALIILLLSVEVSAQPAKYRPQYPAVAATNTRGGFTTPPTFYFIDAAHNLTDNRDAPTAVKTGACAEVGVTCWRSSFRVALEARGCRVVIPERSGYLRLTLNASFELGVSIVNPCITIAGQTAPNPGLTLRDYGIWIDSYDVVLQHFRIRPGGDYCNSGIQIYNFIGGYAGDSYNVIVDHMSVSWGQDEGIAAIADSVLIWRTLIGEGLTQAPGSAGCVGGGLSNGHCIGGGNGEASPGQSWAMIQTIVISCYERSPYLGSGNAILLNNINHNWGYYGTQLANLSTSGGVAEPWKVTSVGNVFLGGQLYPGFTEAHQTLYAYHYYAGWCNQLGITGCVGIPNAIYHSDDLLLRGGWQGTVIAEANEMGFNPNVSSPPTQAPLPAGYTVLASSATEAVVKAVAGARPADRDAVDNRLIGCVTSRSCIIINHESVVGGYPALATNTVDRVSQLPSNPHGPGACGAGYTRAECWLEGFGIALEKDQGGEIISPILTMPWDVRVL